MARPGGGGGVYGFWPLPIVGFNLCSKTSVNSKRRDNPSNKTETVKCKPRVDIDQQYRALQDCLSYNNSGKWNVDTLGFWKLPKMNSPTMNNSQFLPEFLLGDDSQFLTGTLEENTTRIQSPTATDASFSSPPTSAMQLVSPHNRLLTPHRPDYNRGSKGRINGPPTASLFDDKPDNTTLNGSVTSPSSPTNQMETSPISDGTQDAEGHWIVVFGFPPSSSAHILSIFSQLGNVLEHSLPPSGNWMFIRYNCRIEVRKALTNDKRIVNGNIMIGVAERKNVSQMRPIIGTPNTSFNCISSPPSSLKSPRIRHLSTPRRDVQGNDPPVPQQYTSVVARAMDLIFGW